MRGRFRGAYGSRRRRARASHTWRLTTYTILRRPAWRLMHMYKIIRHSAGKPGPPAQAGAGMRRRNSRAGFSPPQRRKSRAGFRPPQRHPPVAGATGRCPTGEVRHSARQPGTATRACRNKPNPSCAAPQGLAYPQPGLQPAVRWRRKAQALAGKARLRGLERAGPDYCLQNRHSWAGERRIRPFFSSGSRSHRVINQNLDYQGRGAANVGFDRLSQRPPLDSQHGQVLGNIWLIALSDVWVTYSLQ